jgi:hypothetical protein
MISLQAVMDDPLVQKTLSNISGNRAFAFNEQLGVRIPLVQYAGLVSHPKRPKMNIEQVRVSDMENMEAEQR